MVKKIFKFLAYVLFFILSLIYFLPKVSAYYFLEEQIKGFDVIISSEEVKDSGFALKLDHAVISTQAIESASVSEVTLKSFILYNSLNVKGIVLASVAENFVPVHVESANASYTVFDPLHVNAYATGDFGEADIKFNLKDFALHVDLRPSELMLKDYKSTLRYLKKNENGEFIYDQNF